MKSAETLFLDYVVKSVLFTRRFFDYLMEQALKKVLLEYVRAMMNKYVLLLVVVVVVDCWFVFINRFIDK